MSPVFLGTKGVQTPVPGAQGLLAVRPILFDEHSRHCDGGLKLQMWRLRRRSLGLSALIFMAWFNSFKTCKTCKTLYKFMRMKVYQQTQ